MKKVLISIFLVVLLLSQSIFVSTASARTVTEQDVEILVELGLLRGDDTGDFRLDDQVTRAEFTAMTLRLMNYEKLAESTSGDSVFDDVSQDHWAKNYILLANELNIVNGVGDNLFEPERAVTQNEAIKIIVSALGYTPLAIHMGNEFPGTFLNIASRLKLLKGMDSDSVFTRGDAALLMKNALTVDIMDGMGTVISGDTVLKRYLGVTPMRGFVTGTSMVSSGKLIKPGNIEIEGKVYSLRQNITEELFGCEVTFYLAEDDATGKDIIYYLDVIENESRLVISNKDILPSTSFASFDYVDEYENNESVTLSEGLSVYYNGKKVSSALMDVKLLIPEQGEVILCDKEEDGIYDIAIVTEYQTVVVNYISSDRIYDVFGNHISIDSGVTLYITRDGEDIDVEELTKGDILTVAKSLDNLNVRILADSQTVEGYVSQITEADGRYSYQVVTGDGETKELLASGNYQRAVELGLASKVLQPDKRVLTLWLDAFGNIALAEVASEGVSSSNATQYGYLIDVASKGALQGTVSLKILTEDNKISVFTLANTVVFGYNFVGSYVQKNTQASAVFDALGGSENVKRQLIQYRADDEGVIKHLYLAAYADDPDVLSEDVPKSLLNYRQGILEQKYFVDDDTIVFSIPLDGEYEDVLGVGKPSSAFTEGWARQCTLYDIKNGHVGAVVVHDKVAITYNSADTGFESIIDYGYSPIFFMTDASERLGEDGEVYLSIDGNQNGKEMSLNLSEILRSDREVSGQLKPGSVIQYETNSILKSWAKTSDEAEQLVVFEKIFDFEADNGSGIRWNHDLAYNSAPDIITLWGTLKTVETSFCSVEVENNGQWTSYPIRFLHNAVFLEYDGVEKEIKPIKQEQLTSGQRVYIFKQSSCMNVVVY